MANISTLGRTLTQMDNLKSMHTQLALLEMQLTTQKKTDLFKGLGSDTGTSTRARANFKMLDTYMSNIDTATRRIKMMDNALGELRAQSENITSAIQIQTQKGEIEKESIADLAKKVKAFMTDLLNERDGDRYLFSGAQSLTSPLTSTGTLDTYTRSRVDEWVNGTLTTDGFINSYKDRTQLTDTAVGYAAHLTDGNPRSVHVRVEERTELDYTVLANDQGLRDVLVAASMLESLCNGIDAVALHDGDPITTVTSPGADHQEQNDNFYKVFNDLAATITKGLDRIETQSFKLSQSYAQMTQIKENHVLEKAILQSTVDDVENVDLNEVAMNIKTLSVQLEAAYRVTATLSTLNMTNFMPMR